MVNKGEENSVQSTQVPYGSPNVSFMSAHHTSEQQLAITGGDADGPQGYRKTSNISCTLVGNKIVGNSDVVGASPVGAAPTTSSSST